MRTILVILMTSSPGFAYGPTYRGVSAESLRYFDDPEVVSQAAAEGIRSIDVRTKSNSDQTTAALDAFFAFLSQQQNDIAALAAAIQTVKDKIQAMTAVVRDKADKISELRAEAEALEQCQSLRRSMVEMFEKLISDIQAKIQDAESKNQPTDSLKRDLVALQAKRDSALKSLDTQCARIVAQLRKLDEEITKTAKARRVLTIISQDRSKAAQLAELIQKNNRTAIAEFLQREAGGGDFIVTEAKVGTAPLVIFRVDTFTHCLSGGAQCGGKIYSLSN